MHLAQMKRQLPEQKHESILNYSTFSYMSRNTTKSTVNVRPA